MSGSSDDFYESLPTAATFVDALSSELYAAAPADWILVMTDVTNSTEAIRKGLYKDVTIAGAVGTIAIANLTGDLDFPFLFGGDGMTYLLPGGYRDDVLDVLAETIGTVRQLSGLELRAAVIPVEEIYLQGGELSVGKLRVSERYLQAMLSGSGLELADELLKERRSGKITFAEEERLNGDSTRADYRGFSCRWLDVPSSKGETVSVIVRSISADPDHGLATLRTLSAELHQLFRDETAAHPLTVELQRLANRDYLGVRAEAEYRSRSKSGLRYALSLLWIRVELAAVALAVRFKLPIRAKGKRLAAIPRDNIENADIRKFDGTLKMTLSVSPEERQRLTELLDRFEKEGAIAYGMHLSDRAIMTCLIHTNHQDEVHFVDAADGGYALAAARLKEKL